MPHFSTHAINRPDQPAYIMADSGDVVTFAELNNRSNQLAHLFRFCGLAQGDHLAMMLKNCKEFLQVAQAASRAGLIFTPISTHLKYEETAYVLENCKATLFIASSDLGEIPRRAAEKVGLVHCYSVGGDLTGFADLNNALSDLPETSIADESLGVPMLYSSGTTGQPKGIYQKPHSETIHVSHALEQTVGKCFGFNLETVYLSPAPLYHAAPLHYNMLVLSLGGTSIIMESFDAEKSLKLIDLYKVTHSQWVPIMFVRMLKLPQKLRDGFDLGSMVVAIHAAAPCPIEVKEAMINWWGPIIVEYYAASESIGFTLIDSPTWLSHKGSVGLPLFGDPRILSENGDVLGPMEVGEVYFAGSLGFEYFGEPEKTSKAFNDRGWATTGDMGYLDEHGFLYLTDRKDFTIISGGVNIYPAEIEGLMITHEKVADVAVFGIPDSDFGESVFAVVQPVAGVEVDETTEVELVEWMRERLSGIKIPRKIEFKDKLPRMDNGKLYKRHLINAYRH